MNVLITGASSGFGKETAIALAESGHTIFAAMRSLQGKNKNSADHLLELSATLTGQIIPIEMDVSSDKSVEKAVSAVLSQITGSLDVVINNAGVYIGGLNETISLPQVEQTFNVNLLGAVRVMRTVLPTFRQQGKGTIINVTSSLSKLVLPLSGLYTASKAALEALSESYAYELAPLGIETLILQPGSFNTGIMNKSQRPDDGEKSSGYCETLNQAERISQQYINLVKDSFINNSPRFVADSIVDLLAIPYGERPFRTLVDPSGLGEQVKVLNSHIEQSQQTFMQSVGCENMMQIKGA
ncbi:SDR family oxidoreductase [Photobacterium sp. OFAV2-7]|uniref:SDR family oxidoreductase n=1 Tax=Photobacterium sp. OFAV2-7 TaxID=2917748 RepID=UPI001EF4B591|nr:SDR family oxidoreductase [Photobacterium sp. OFAV2-7]MCG7585574.1 SDR family oxidoreductase [Photobacterium sp. OFAV2-7]